MDIEPMISDFQDEHANRCINDAFEHPKIQLSWFDSK